ncbi:MAG TPA: zinc-ribbon domain-containing protein [Candidatus Brocadiia bacterium]
MLVICPECENKISSYAKECPRCGFLIHKAGAMH